VIVILAPKAQLAVDTLSLEPPPALTIEAEYGAFVCEGTRYTSAHHQAIGSPYVSKALDHAFGKPAPCNDQNIPVLDENDVVLISHIDLDTIGGIMRATGKYNDCFTEKYSEFWDLVEKLDIVPDSRSLVKYKTLEVIENLEAFISQTLEEMPFPLDKNSDVTYLCQLVSEQVKEALLQGDDRNERTFIALTPFSLILRKTDDEPCNDLFSDPEGTPALAVISYDTSKKKILLSLNDISTSEIEKGLSCIKVSQELWGDLAQGSDIYASSPPNKEMNEEDFKIAADLFSKKIVSTLYSF